MAETAIEWTHVPGFKGATWNPTTGCDRVSPGCANCYALTMAKRLKAMGQPSYQRDGDPRTSGPGFGLSMHEERLTEPLRWRKPRAVFVNSMSDLFHERIPDAFVADVFAVMALASHHTFQILTKRPERARVLVGGEGFHEAIQERVERLAFDGTSRLTRDRRFVIQSRARAWLSLVSWPLPNVWLGTSIENARFTYRADVLRQIPAAVRFISAEPLLGSLYRGDPVPSLLRDGETIRLGLAPLDLTGIDWVIVGGESGPKARPFHLEHAREIIDAALAQCGTCSRVMGAASVGQASFNGGDWRGFCGCERQTSVFVKQLGAKPRYLDDLTIGVYKEKPLALRDRKGGDWDEWPADLRIREFPRSAA